jgi:large subunit ribosomal protein L24e
MVKCSFCGKEEHAHKGSHLIKNDGSISYFCSSKCRVNATKLNRDKRKIRWAEAFHVKREKARAKVGKTA